MKYMLTIAFVVMLSVSAYAEEKGGYTTTGNISRFREINSNGNFVVQGTWQITDEMNLPECTNTSKWVVGGLSGSTPDSVKSMFSMIMSAYLSGDSVQFYVDECNSSGQPLVKSIWIPNRFSN